MKFLKSMRPIVVNPTMTYDMGIECTIATKDGVIYPVPGMFLFCGGTWPINEFSKSDIENTKEEKTFSLHISEDKILLFTNIPEMEQTFVKLFNIDANWEAMSDKELMNWHKVISSDGRNIVSIATKK